MNCGICGEPGHENNENQAYLCISYLRAQQDAYHKIAFECAAYVEAEQERGRMHGIDGLFDDMVKAIGAAKVLGITV